MRRPRGATATATHIQLGLLDDTFTARPVRRRKPEPQLSMFTGAETIGPLRLCGRPCGPIGGPFNLRLQGQPKQPTLTQEVETDEIPAAG